MAKVIDIMSVLGGPSASGEASSADMACKALWKATKSDDYDAFKSAMREYVKYIMAELKSEPDEDDSDD